MKNKEYFIKTLKSLLHTWGGDTPKEAIWAFNDLLGFVDKEYDVRIDQWLEEDCSNEDLIFNQLNKYL